MALTPELRIAIGKRAGLTSGLLGMLCVLAELCFLLPDLLVTRDALPIYKAHIGLFRGILQASIFATFALGALGVALSRPNRRGLLGISLGVTALLMGGAEAEPLDIAGSRAFSAGLDYFVLELLVLGLIFIPLEGLFPLRVQRVFRDGWQTDLKHFFVSHAGVQLLSFAALIPAQVLLAWAVQLEFQKAVAPSRSGCSSSRSCSRWISPPTGSTAPSIRCPGCGASTLSTTRARQWTGSPARASTSSTWW